MTKMYLSYVLLAIVILQARAETPIIVSGLDTTTISDGVLTVSSYPYGVNFPVPKAQWIWN